MASGDEQKRRLMKLQRKSRDARIEDLKRKVEFHKDHIILFQREIAELEAENEHLDSR